MFFWRDIWVLFIIVVVLWYDYWLEASLPSFPLCCQAQFIELWRWKQGCKNKVMPSPCNRQQQHHLLSLCKLCSVFPSSALHNKHQEKLRRPLSKWWDAKSPSFPSSLWWSRDRGRAVQMGNTGLGINIHTAALCVMCVLPKGRSRGFVPVHSRLWWG